MANPVATIIRFDGDPDDLHDRFEQARRSWGSAQARSTPPAFYAACKTDQGIAVVIGWATDSDHKAFGRQMGPHLEAFAMRHPDHVERLPISRLGWAETSPEEA